VSRTSRIIYTLEPCSDISVDMMTLNYQAYNDFLTTLAYETVLKLNNIMMIVGSSLLELLKTPNIDYDKYLVKLCRDDTVETIKSYVDCKPIRLIERVVYKNDSDEDTEVKAYYYDINNKVIKLLLITNLRRYGIREPECSKIMSHFGLSDYYDVTDRLIDHDYNFAEYIKRYNGYLHEFYCRNNNTEDNLLEIYHDRSWLCSQSAHRLEGFADDIKFDMILPNYLSKDVALSVVENYSNSMKSYVERMYEFNYVEDAFKASSGKGRKHYSNQFSLWDRYLRIYDLFKENMLIDNKVTNPKVDKIGKIIAAEFKVFGSYGLTDRRKEILKGYKEALRLIELSKTGVLY